MLYEPRAKTKPFTLEDLAKLLESLPRPDDDYFDDVEEVMKNQRPVSNIPWD